MFNIGTKILTINNYIGEIIEVAKDSVTVFYKKDNSTEIFKLHQLDSLKYMINRYNKN